VLSSRNSAQVRGPVRHLKIKRS